MKAASSLLVMSQRPLTIFGIPPTLLGLVGAAGALAAVPTILLDWIAAMLPVTVLSFGAMWLVFWRATRRDPHFDRLLFKPSVFWRGRERRSLLAGGR